VGNASKCSEGILGAGCDDHSVSEVSVVQQNILANPTTAVALSQLSLNLSGCNISNPNIHSTVGAIVATACGPGSGAPTDVWNDFKMNDDAGQFADSVTGSINSGSSGFSAFWAATPLEIVVALFPARRAAS